MRSVQLHISNRTELLAGQLAELLNTPSGGPLEPETVLVQGRGMATWLSMQLAQRHGVCANLDFSYPRAFVHRVLRAILGDEAVDTSELDESRLFWLILRDLPELLERPEFQSVRAYLAHDPRSTKPFELASKLATTFDQYLIYRPELIRIWENGKNDGAPPNQHWQPILWRRLRESITGHLAALEAGFLRGVRELDPKQLDHVALPARVSVFGVTTLPPSFIRILTALTPLLDLHVFAFQASGSNAKDPLLSSLHAQGQEFLSLLLDGATEADVGLCHHRQLQCPDSEHLLGRVQQQLYGPPPGKPGEQLSLLGLNGEPAQPKGRRVPLDLTDRTLQIHACHSPMREVEALHDNLLELLAAKEARLEPQHIVVMTPDIETYAPLVEAVFDRTRDSPQFIPYRISDRGARADSPVLDAFQRILSMVGGRATSTEVLDLLTIHPVQRRFGITPEEVETITEWVIASGIRWGIDAEHREQEQQPRTEQNTWRMGLDRLLLGYAMPTEGQHTFGDVLPYDEIEGGGAELLGRFAHFVDVLFSTLRRLKGSRPIARWQSVLEQSLSDLIHFDFENATQHQRIQNTLGTLVTDSVAARYEAEIPLAALTQLIDSRIDAGFSERGFLSNGVTFCAMIPMRTIPFPVVCLLGMNDGAFPRVEPGVDFDLIRSGGSGTRPGDRDRRKDDRQLFLEALMAARQTLIITYTGQSIRDNTQRPPSVVVSELLDSIAANHDPAPAASHADETPPTQASGEAERVRRVIRTLVVRHPLQAFSRSYFDGSDPRLFSYSGAYQHAAKQLGPERVPIGDFFSGALRTDDASAESAAHRTVTLRELVQFWGDPVRELLERRLQLFLREDSLDVPDREPIELDALEVYGVGNTMLHHELEGLTPERSLQLLRAAGHLPLGALAEHSWGDLHPKTRELAARVRNNTPGEPKPRQLVSHQLPGGWTCSGELGERWDGACVAYQYSKLRAKHMLTHWIRHLLLLLSEPDARTVVIGRHPQGSGIRELVFHPVSNAGHLLTELIELRNLGLEAPLRFAPRTSLSYQLALRNTDGSGEGERDALRAATQEYSGQNSERSYAPHLRRVFGDHQPPFSEVFSRGPEFQQLAERVFGPLLVHMEEG